MFFFFISCIVYKGIMNSIITPLLLYNQATFLICVRPVYLLTFYIIIFSHLSARDFNLYFITYWWFPLFWKYEKMQFFGDLVFLKVDQIILHSLLITMQFAFLNYWVHTHTYEQLFIKRIVWVHSNVNWTSFPLPRVVLLFFSFRQ